jgi:hypothetical protein
VLEKSERTKKPQRKNTLHSEYQASTIQRDCNFYFICSSFYSNSKIFRYTILVATVTRIFWNHHCDNLDCKIGEQKQEKIKLSTTNQQPSTKL